MTAVSVENSASSVEIKTKMSSGSDDSTDRRVAEKSENIIESKSDTASTPKPTVRHTEPRIFKIIVIGDSNVGKTCLAYRFCDGGFPSKVEATIGVDFKEKTVEIGGEVLKLQLWDTAGQERFRRSMVPHYYRNVHAVVYVYDMTNRETFQSLNTWLGEYNRHTPNSDTVPRILIGNKCDLTNLVAVNSNEAQRFADRYNMPAFETSARDDSKADHVESIFMTLAHKLKEKKPMMGSKYSLSTKESTTPQVLRYTTIGQDKKSECAC